MAKVFVLELTLEEIQLAAAGLAEMPYRVAAPLMAKVQMQVEQQSRPQPVPTPLAVVASDAAAPRRAVQDEPEPVVRRRRPQAAMLGGAAVSALNAGSAPVDPEEVARSFAETREAR